MRLIEEGHWKQVYQCRSCNSRVEAEADDIEFGDFGAGYGDDHDWRFFWRCPWCKTQNKPPESTLAPHVMTLARARQRTTSLTLNPVERRATDAEQAPKPGDPGPSR
jgi:hypothetical protein